MEFLISQFYSFFVNRFRLPDQRDPVPVACLDVAVKGVIREVELPSDKPLIVLWGKFVGLVPMLEPVKLLGLPGPEPLGINLCFSVD